MGEDFRIVVLQRGWVVVGRFSQEGEECRLDGAQCIRRWGTTQGLGELCGGPLRETKLDKMGPVKFHVLTVVFSMAVAADGWRAVCGS